VSFVLPELDERDREEQRYVLYEIRQNASVDGLWDGPFEIAATPTLEGIGRMIDLLREEEQITNDSRVGLLDRVERKWLINPYARGRL
jgi:hypothetical protein